MSKQIKVLVWAPAALWYGIIWRFSAQPAAVSGNLSDRLLWRLLAALSPAFSSAPQSAQTASVELLSFFERKTAHIFLYFILALLVSFAVGFLCRRFSVKALLTFLVCAIMASLDEYHQTLVPGRSGEIRDVMVDLTGVIIALGLTAMPLLAAWCRRNLGFPLPALVPAALCLLPFLPALTPAEALMASPAILQIAEQFVPQASTLTPAQWSGLLKNLAPILREVLFITACGLMGVFLFMAGKLANKSGKVLFTAVFSQVILAALLAGFFKLPFTALGPALLGTVFAALLWELASHQNR